MAAPPSADSGPEEMVNERDYGYKHVPGHLHIQEVSEDSTIAEHKLSELVSPTRRLPASDHRISQPLPLRSHTQSYLPTPQSYHHASNLPAAHRTSPSPPLSSGSGPTVLQSFPSWDPTWRSGRVDEDGRAFTTHVPSGHLDLVYPTHGDVETRSEGHTKYRHNAAEPYLGGWVRDDNHSGEARPYSYETPLDEGYRLGVGFGDNTGPNSKGRLSEERKAKRLRALQREFGISAPSTSHNQSTSGSSRPAKYTDTASAYKRLRNKQKQEEKALEEEVGVDRQGNLIVYHARKWRVAARWLQSLLALTAAVCGIGGNAVIRPGVPPPPPQGRLTTWLLYVATVLTALFTLYTATVRRWMRRRRANALRAQQRAAHDGRFGLPVLSHNGYSQLSSQAEKALFGKSKKKYKGQHLPWASPMTVNLVVDPQAMASMMRPTPAQYDSYVKQQRKRGARRPGAQREQGAKAGAEDSLDSESSSDDDYLDEEKTFEPSQQDDADYDFPIPRTKRSEEESADPFSIFSSVLHRQETHERWQLARRRTRIQAVWDLLFALLWLFLPVWAIFSGGRCPPGGSKGWCDLYNVMVASGVFLALLFSTSFVFDVLDLRRSRTPPAVSGKAVR